MDRHSFILLFLVLVLAVVCIADVVTTEMILDAGGGESNKFMVNIVNSVGNHALVKCIFFNLVVLFAVIYEKYYGTLPYFRYGSYVILGVAIVIIAQFAVIHNLLLLIEHGII